MTVMYISKNQKEHYVANHLSPALVEMFPSIVTKAYFQKKENGDVVTVIMRNSGHIDVNVNYSDLADLTVNTVLKVQEYVDRL